MPSNSLLLHRILVRAALAGAHLFAWVFVFQYFYVQQRSVSAAFVSVLLSYALSHVIVVLLTPVSARRLRHGYRRSLTISTLALAASFAILAAAFSGTLGDIPLGIALFAICIGLYRAFYWAPYAIAAEHSRVPRREWVEIAVALAPLAAGLYLTSGGAAFVALLYAAALLVAFAAAPLPYLPEAHEGFAWKYRETFHELFDSRHRSVFWSSFFSGAESAALFILWPIAVFTFVDWSYPLLGAVMSLTLIFTLLAKKLFSGALSTVPVRVQPLVAASGWVMRLGASGFVGAVLVDTYFHTASRSAQRGIDISSYEHAADNSTFVDEYTALKEMAMGIGRIALCLVSALLLSVFALPYAIALSLLLAAAAAGFSVYHALAKRRAF